jgi:hypothetical protein
MKRQNIAGKYRPEGGELQNWPLCVYNYSVHRRKIWGASIFRAPKSKEKLFDVDNRKSCIIG